MKDFTLSQQYAMIGLDGQDCLHGSISKSVAMRAIAAAEVLEKILGELELSTSEFEEKLNEGMAQVGHLKKKDLQFLEQEVSGCLQADNAMEIAPDLMGCDLNYYTAGNSMKVYRSDRDVYQHIVEGVRAEILEDGPVTDECVILLWLFRESCCMHEIFSTDEQQLIATKMIGICAQNEKYGVLWKMEFHQSLEIAAKRFLQGKHNFFKNPYLEGINLLFPFLDRRQAIFIDFVILGTSVGERRLAVLNFLTERGHYVEEVKKDGETLLRVDNMYYRIWPKTISCGRIPIQGAELLPVYR